jgi:Domain of unknown function (DUF4440)
MKKVIGLFAFSILFSFRLFAQNEKDSIETSIIRFFDGLSEFNNDKLRNYSAHDFLLLEDGEVWNLDTLINKLAEHKHLKIERINKFQFIRTEQSGNVAWVSYYNTAELKFNDKQQTVKWLESAVLTKHRGRWIIKQLHSTPLK